MRVAYLDLDGTLTRDGSMFHGEAGPTLAGARALAQLIEAGFELVPCSGRNVGQLREVARLFGSRTFVAELGSVVAYDGGARRVAVSATGHDVRSMRAQGLDKALFSEFPGLEYHTPWSEWRDHTLLLRGEADATALDAWVRERHPGLRAVDNGPIGEGGHAFHVLPDDVGKGHAIARDRETRGLGVADCVAFGDSVGDLEMADHVSRFFWIGGGDGDPRGRANVDATTARYAEGLEQATRRLLDTPPSPR